MFKGGLMVDSRAAIGYFWRAIMRPSSRILGPLALLGIVLATAGCLQVTSGFVDNSPTTSGGLLGGPQIDCNPQSVIFPPTNANQTATVMVGCKNTGSSVDGQNLLITIASTGSNAFNAAFTQSSYPPAGLAPGQTAGIAVSYSPVTVSDDQGGLALSTNVGSVTIPLTGYGLSPSCQLSFPTASLDFGGVTVGTTKGPSAFPIVNSGQTDCQIEAPIRVVDDPSGSFQVVSTNLQAVGSQYSLSPPGGPTSTLVVQVTFTPKTTGSLRASAGDFVALSGTGQ